MPKGCKLRKKKLSSETVVVNTTMSRLDVDETFQLVFDIEFNATFAHVL